MRSRHAIEHGVRSKAIRELTDKRRDVPLILTDRVRCAQRLADRKTVVVVARKYNRGWFEDSCSVRRKQPHCSFTDHEHGVSASKLRTDRRVVAGGEDVGRRKNPQIVDIGRQTLGDALKRPVDHRD